MPHGERERRRSRGLPDRRRHVSGRRRRQPGAFENKGTSQPKFGLRFDQDFENGGPDAYEGGYYGTEGIVHTGIGPFRLENGSYMAYGRVSYNKGALRISAFGNFLDAEAPNLLVFDPDTLGPIILAFKTQTYDFEIGNTNVLGGQHIVTYGGNVRQNNFDISLAHGDNRTELGAYGQWEYFVDKFRIAVGGRVDKFGNLDDPVFSPRVSVDVQAHARPLDPRVLQPRVRLAVVHQQLPEPEHRQFPPDRSTSGRSGRLLGRAAPLVPPPFLLTINAYGNPDLKEQVDRRLRDRPTPERSEARRRSDWPRT